MKKLQRYILADTLKALVPAFAALTLVMVLGLCMQLLYDGLDVVRLRSLLVPLIAHCVPLVLPPAFLTAVILSFGRLAADNELIAVRAAGISLFRVIYPVFGAAVALTVVAAVFQFELLPRSQAAIKTLKYDALKQIVLDQVAMSARRQFAFKPVYIVYDDFINGRMTDLLVINIEPYSRRPETIITAASSVLRQDPGNDQNIVFEMKDCVITSFALSQRGETGTVITKDALLTAHLGAGSDDILSSDKYLPTVGLFKRLRYLRERVAGKPDLTDPEGAKSREKKLARALDIEIAQVDEQLVPLQEKLKKSAESDPSRYRQVINQDRERLDQIRKEVGALKEQQAACLEEITRASSGEVNLVDYNRLVELQNRYRSLQQDMETRQQESDGLDREVADTTRLLTSSSEKAAEYQAKIAELRQYRTTLVVRRFLHNRNSQVAKDHEDLDGMLVRIHKRFAQAVSMLAFAFLGIPLGIMAGGRNVMVAFGLSFAIVLLVFYPFSIFGEVAAQAGVLPMVPAIWAGDAFLLVVGAVLTVKVARG